MDAAEQKTLLHMIEIEKKAEEILVDKNDKIKLDMRRNWDRESIRALEKLKTNEKVWTLFGSNYIRLTKEKAKNILEDDLKEANIEINKIHSELKLKMNDLRDLEYKEKYEGFSLNPLSRKEMSAVKQVWGESS
ncbi:hypothetical protein PGB90_007075 [Kerria lacca]